MIYFITFFYYITFFYLSILKSKKASQSRKAKQSKDEEEDEGPEDASTEGTPVASIVVETTQASVEVSIAHFHIDPGHYSKSPRSRSTIQLMHY